MYVADALELREGDRSTLDSLTRSVLLAAVGVPNTEVAERTGTLRPTVRQWAGTLQRAGYRRARR